MVLEEHLLVFEGDDLVQKIALVLIKGERHLIAVVIEYDAKSFNPIRRRSLKVLATALGELLLAPGLLPPRELCLKRLSLPGQRLELSPRLWLQR